MYKSAANKLFTIAGLKVHECPVSFISHESKELLEVYSRARRGREAFGVGLFGPDWSQWPTWAVDLTQLLETERQRVEAAEAEIERRKTDG